ncbi:MAG: hypothetical protein ACP5I8_14325 [Phycisphaerae bacterium]
MVHSKFVLWRAWLGWCAYGLGWLAWLASLPLKADYDYPAINPWGINPFPVPAGVHADQVIAALVGGIALQRKYVALANQLYIAYYLGVLICVIWLFVRLGPRWLRVIGRMGSLGMLAVWFEVAYASQHYNFLALPGYPALAVGSTLVCLGVWLIPPRQKCGNSTGEDGKQRTAIDANRDSGTEGT